MTVKRHPAKKRPGRPKPVKGGKRYAEVWRLVDGCILDTMNAHPDYFLPGRAMTVRTSLTKRITGAVIGFAAEAVEGSGTNERGRPSVGVRAGMRGEDQERHLIGRCCKAIKAWVAATTHATFSAGRPE